MQCVCTILLSVACPAVQNFYILSYKRNDLREKKFSNFKCVFFSTNFSENFPILRRTERDMIMNAYLSSCEVPVILVRF